MILLVQSFQSKAGPATGFFERNYYGMIGTTYNTFYVTQAAMLLLKLFLLGKMVKSRLQWKNAKST